MDIFGFMEQAKKIQPMMEDFAVHYKNLCDRVVRSELLLQQIALKIGVEPEKIPPVVPLIKKPEDDGEKAA